MRFNGIFSRDVRFYVLWSMTLALIWSSQVLAQVGDLPDSDDDLESITCPQQDWQGDEDNRDPIAEILSYLPETQEAGTSNNIPTSQRPEEILYNKMHPLHIKLCFSGYAQRVDKTYLPSPHSFMYIKGLCLDKDSPYPRLIKCPEGSDLSDPNTGVGVTVINGNRNINFTIVPGLDLLMTGTMKKGQKLTKEVYSQMAEDFVNTGAYKGVVWQNDVLPIDRKTKKRMRSEDREAQIVMAKRARGSDWAFLLSRSVYCTNIPVSEVELDKVMAYLNKMNQKFYDEVQEKGKKAKGLKFDYLANNCCHLTSNALAEIGLLKGSKTNRNFFSMLTYIPVPSVTVADVLFQANEDDIDFAAFKERMKKYQRQVGLVPGDKEGGEKVAGKKVRKGKNPVRWGKDLPEKAFLRMRSGVILQKYGVWENNKLFNPSIDTYLISTALYKNVSKKIPRTVLSVRDNSYYRKLLQQPHLSSLPEHYDHLLVRIDKALQDLDNSEDKVAGNSDEEDALKKRYRQLLVDERESILLKKEQLAQLFKEDASKAE